jgi:transketolase
MGLALAELGDRRPDVVVLDADLSNATRSIHFARRHPERFFNMGITEANMVSVAAGLATCGKIPFACTFAFLLALRAADQIRSLVSYAGLNVKLVGTNAGLSGFGDGATHQSIMDVAIMRAMPRMTVIVPSDEASVRWAVAAAAEHTGPVFIRVPRVPAPAIHGSETRFELGKGLILRQGSDVSIVACGMMVSRALRAAELLHATGIEAEVIEIHTVKPIDTQLLVDSATRTGAVVTVEEHNRFGGLFSAVAEVLAEHAPVPIECVAIPDRFGGSGQYEELLEECGLTVQNVVEKAKRALSRKGHRGANAAEHGHLSRFI